MQTSIETISTTREVSPKHASDASERPEAPKEHHKEHRFHFFASNKGADADKDKESRNGKSQDTPSIGDHERAIRAYCAEILHVAVSL